ncbi:MAG TPA: T9SS type A sorting domain-containing protein, partial [Phaeodactylibacter sp.]|nr:T9SS type A sorting domain-containing protein [Phaeodactylibacter sp.]
MKSNYRQSFILLLFPFFLHAQAIYDGQIRDVATHNPVSFVKVELLHSDVHTFANQYGDFLLKNTETDSIPHNSVQYRFFNNAIIWEGDHDIAMELFSIDGRLLRSIPDLGNAGSYLLPNLPVGIYLLRLRTGDDIQTFKLFSNGIFTRIASREAVWHRSSVAPREDTLMLSKEGYYTRLIPLSGNDTLLRINMLKKENKELHYFNELIAPLAFDLLSSAPPRTYDAYVSTVKIIHNHDDDLMYYINTKRYKYHFTFAEKQLGFKKGNFVFNQTQYLENENRYLYPANLNYYQDLDIYVLYLVSGNQMSCENIKLLYQKILETSYLSKEQLFLFANRPEFQNCEVPLISPEELYEGQNYQALNLAENYGYLRKVERKELEDTYLSRHDIIVFDAIPNDVSVVAGIITTDFQTPLSHINILSHNRGTPNMALRNAWNNPQLDSLLGELVFLKVQSDSFILRKATLAEANAFWALHEPQEIITLDKDTTFQGLVDLAYANHSYTDRIGGKASNFAEILKVHLDGNPIPVPEGAFAIPFYYYEQHLKDAGLYDFINQMLVDSAFINQPELRKARLKELRDRIKDHPLNPELIQLVENKINHFADFSAYRFRSSTN